jgi:hypothetical protein
MKRWWIILGWIAWGLLEVSALVILWVACGTAGRIIAVAGVLGLFAAVWFFRPRWRGAAAAFLLFPIGLIWLLLIRPQTERDWSPDQERLPKIEIDGNTVTVRNVRNCDYRSETDYDVRWEDRTYDLAKLRTVWFAVELFSDWRGAAHTLVSFGFEGGETIAVSVEVRREKGEEFSALGGMFRQFELMYVFADERDVIRLRTNCRKDDVRLYPIKATTEEARRFFLDMCERANRLATRPEFYNTFTNNCTTNIADHVNARWPGQVPFGRKVLFPGYSDELAYDLGLIDAEGTLEEIRERFLINAKAQEADKDPDFSKKIRP